MRAHKTLRASRAFVVGCAALLAGMFVGPELARGEGRTQLAKAQKALEKMDLNTAASAAEAAFRAGRNPPSVLVQIYAVKAQLAAINGRVDDARKTYMRMLAIDPRAKLPRGLEPKVVRPFTRARQEMSDLDPIDVNIRSPSVGDSRLVVFVEADPFHMVAGVVVRDREGKRLSRGKVSRSGKIIVAMPSEIPTDLTVEVVDSRFNILSVRSVRWPQAPAFAGAAALGKMRRLEMRRSARPLYSRWYVWGALGLGAALGGLYYGRQATSDWLELDIVVRDSGNHTFEEAQYLEQRGRRHALYSNTALALSGVLSATSLILWVRDGVPDDAVRISATPTRTGASISMGLKF